MVEHVTLNHQVLGSSPSWGITGDYMFFLFVAIVVGVAVLWAEGIEYMNENHFDYTGNDFLNWTGEHEI